MLIVSLSHRRSEVQKGGATGDAHHHRFPQGLCHAQGIEACRALVGDWEALDIRAFMEVVNDRGVPTARTHHCALHSMSHQQGC